ncbi:hypothetical protein GCM10025795_41840 [Verticiella sediminum]
MGDGVTKSLFYTRRLLRELGYESEIFCIEPPPPSLSEEVHLLAQLPAGADYVLLQHHSLGFDDDAWLESLAAPRILIYHNITPPHLLHGEDLQRLACLGREQLRRWAPQCVGAIGDSDYNSEELREAGYANVVTLALLVDLDATRGLPWDAELAGRLHQTLNILFVGRINENKHQHELIEVFDEFLHYTDQPARLILAGGTTSEAYERRLRDMAQARGGESRVWITGKVDEAGLQALYRSASLFVCLSEHEGFCMPVIEAMQHDVPVIARDAGALAATMGEGGLVLEHATREPRDIAALMHTVLTQPGLRRRILRGQRRNLARYETHNLREGLATYLGGLQIHAPIAPPMPAEGPDGEYWQVEGPVDSFYSLAIVNRNMALALAAQDVDVGLDGQGAQGGSQEPDWLERHAPEAALLAQRARTQRQFGAPPRVSLRFQYPPWVDGMRGELRVMHAYCWEESVFPAAYVAAFNRGLDLVTTAATSSARILRQSGIRTPIVTTGIGVDHVLARTPQPFALPAEAEAGFRFLHVSSCFARKGVDVLLEAWGKAFRRADDVVLVIKTFPNPHNDVFEQLARWQARDHDYPRVAIINEDIPDEQLLWLYQACQALVAPSRGEGFGMPMAEAMLFDLPVIVTAWGGHRDFCTPETAWLCDFDFAFARSHLGVPHSVWADPKASHLAELMREVHGLSPAGRARRTEAARALVLNEYTWARVAERARAAIAAVEAAPGWRREPRVAWVSSWNTRCGIATYSAFLAQAIPRDRLLMLAAHAHAQLGEDEDFVRRCWREDIDNDVLADVEAQLESADVDAVVIQYNFGFFSVRALGRLVRRLRERGVRSYVFLHSSADVVRKEQGDRISLSVVNVDLSQAHQIVVHSVEDMNRLKSFGLVENVMLLPHGVPVLAPVDAEAERRARGLAGKRIVAMYGFLLPHKGAQTLLRAFARLARLDASLHLLFVTALYPAPVSEQEKRDCEALVERLGLHGRVTMITDFLPDAESQAWLQTAELIVYPYQETQESASGAVRGGLATGKPVVVTPLGIFDEVADAVHRLHGMDDAAVAEGLWMLMNDEAELAALAERGRRWCDARRWPDISRRLLAMLEGDANDVAPPARLPYGQGQ